MKLTKDNGVHIEHGQDDGNNHHSNDQTDTGKGNLLRSFPLEAPTDHGG